MLFLFNICDTAGRLLGGLPKFSIARETTICGSLTRVIFLPTFFLIAYQIGFFCSDWFKTVNVCLFAITNGFISTSCAILAPGIVPSQMAQQTGNLLGCCITLGITAGAFIAIPVGTLGINTFPVYPPPGQ